MANVLVVDDSGLTHMLLDVMLRRLNHRVLSAYHGNDALEILSKTSVDLIISDVNMPHMDGLTLLENLRREAGGVYLATPTQKQETAGHL